MEQALNQDQELPTNFIGLHLPLEDNAFETLGSELGGIEPNVLRALVKQESDGKPFDTKGRPTILFEPYQFHKLTGGKFDNSHPYVSVREASKSHYGLGGDHQFARLETAMHLNKDAALMATSWGFWQCMGYQYSRLGYASVEAMIHDFCNDANLQLEAFKHFLIVNGLVPLLACKDWDKISLIYNGPGYVHNHYNTDLEDNYKHFQIQYPPTQLPKHLDLTTSTVEIEHPSEGVVTQDLPPLNMEQPPADPVPAAVAIAAEPLETTPSAKVTHPLNSKRVAAGVLGSGVAVGSLPTASDIGDSLTKAHQQLQAISTDHIVSAAQKAKTVAIGQHAVHQSQQLVWLCILLALVILVMAAFIVWTKLHDTKKSVTINPGQSKLIGTEQVRAWMTRAKGMLTLHPTVKK